MRCLSVDMWATPASLTPVEKRLRLVRLTREVNDATPDDVMALSAPDIEWVSSCPKVLNS